RTRGRSRTSAARRAAQFAAPSGSWFAPCARPYLMSTSTGKAPANAADTPLRGGALCLDYANTVDRGSDDEPWQPETTDVLTTRDSLGTWAARMGIPAPRRPPAGELREARRLRDAVYRAFSAISRGRTPS